MTGLPPAENTVYQANTVQKALYRAWQQTVKDWKNPDVLIVNGEPIEGQQRHNNGVENWTTNLIDQINGACQLVEMFGAKKIYVTRGTPYHVHVAGVPVEEFFGRQIGAEKVKGRYTTFELFLKIEGVTFNFAHHIGTSSVYMYRATPLSRDMAMMKLNESHKHPAQVFVRSHAHYYWDSGSTGTREFVTPCWKLQDEYGYKLGPGSRVPDIGALRFKVNGEHFDWELKHFKMKEFKPPLIVER